MPKTTSQDGPLDIAHSGSIERVIHVIRGKRVILDADLAKIYGVPTRVLNQAVKRNRERFPSDFVMQASAAEIVEINRSQTVIGSQLHRDPRARPLAFTEHGAIMAATVLNSPSAVQMSLFVVRAFVKMRAILTDTRELTGQLHALEKELKQRLDVHEAAIFDILQRVMEMLDPPPPILDAPKGEIGFHAVPLGSSRPEPAKN